ncbi:MAG: hypothetical protein JNM17_38745 [Archangium sp.]|nr:hypothetical protein [Archangium sp.]
MNFDALNPDDEAAWQVYADSLQAAGDPRGELMAVQARGADPAAREREAALIQAHASTWLFDGVQPLLGTTRLASRREGSPLRLEWKHGFPHTVTIEGVGYRSEVKFAGLGETWRSLCTDPRNMRFVRRVVFESTSTNDSEPSWSDAVDAVVEHTPPWLRSLSFDRGNFWDISSTSIDVDTNFWKAVPRLEELYLEIGQINLGAIDHPTLKKFSIVSGGFSDVETIATAKWPALEHLSLWFGRDEYGGLEEPGPVEELIAVSPPPKLKHLGLCNATFADQLPAIVLGSKWLSQLDSLDLSRGTIGDAGANVLINAADRLKHVKEIDLSGGYFSDEVEARLRSTFPGVVLNDLQGEAEPEDRYVSLSE